MTTSAEEQRRQEEENQHKHIILNRKHAYYVMVISLKPIVPDFTSHEVTYWSTKSGWDATVENYKTDGSTSYDNYWRHIKGEKGRQQHHYVDGAEGDENDPWMLYVTVDNNCLWLSDEPDIVFTTKVIPLSKIRHIFFDAYKGADGVSDISDIILSCQRDGISADES
jgi:hypothetical protein